MNALVINLARDKKHRETGNEESLKDKITRLKKELNRAAEKYGHRHQEVVRIMSELDPLIALDMDKQYQAIEGQ